ncbi:UNVERIFIED_CONTAM: RAN GTPase-activating protein 2 [Sesamum radiatum]|uniref:RAN GTPase-activating protein 2 n=1 Tax=Sesamum radiatum TaxID=300843 RepID=A0AAW2UD69_SESRA
MDARTPNGERRHITIKLWPPSQNTRQMLVERMTNNLSTPTIFTRKYGSLSNVEASKHAKQIEESAFASANQHYEQEPDGDGSSAVQLYARECSKLILDVLKGGSRTEEKEALQSEVDSAFRETFFDISKGAAHVAGPILASIKNQLKEVDLSDFVAGRPEAEALDVMNIFSEALEGSHLKSLNISDNALGEKGVRAFGKLLQSQTSLEELYLMNDGISKEAAQAVWGIALTEALTQCRNLKKLDLRDNMFGVEAGVKLSDALRKHECLTEIYLSYLNLEDDGAIAIANALKESAPALAVLEMAGNDITAEAAPA